MLRNFKEWAAEFWMLHEKLSTNLVGRFVTGLGSLRSLGRRCHFGLER